MKSISVLFVVLFFLLINCSTPAETSSTPLFTGPLGIQAYTYRHSWANPIAVLDTIRQLGITEYEGGPVPGYTAEQSRKLLNERGIYVKSVGTVLKP